MNLELAPASESKWRCTAHPTKTSGFSEIPEIRDFPEIDYLYCGVSILPALENLGYF
jgi:hypothetical protein